MFASRSKWIALGLVVAAVAAPTALAESQLAAKTEAAGFTAITQYLVQHASQSDTSALAATTEAKGFLALQPRPVDVPQLGAQTEAKGYRAIVRYQEQLAAPPSVPLITDTLAPGGGIVVSAPAPGGFDWVDAGIGAAATAGLLLVLLGSGRVLQQHRRRLAAA